MKNEKFLLMFPLKCKKKKTLNTNTLYVDVQL